MAQVIKSSLGISSAVHLFEMIGFTHVSLCRQAYTSNRVKRTNERLNCETCRVYAEERLLTDLYNA